MIYIAAFFFSDNDWFGEIYCFISRFRKTEFERCSKKHTGKKPCIGRMIFAQDV